ncbi:subtilisin-like protein [Lactarius psammicola]|nr:subtilisin-like protein [Lactarius psammicola]
MRYHCISVLSVLASVPLGSFAKPFSPHSGDMRIKHSWNAIPKNWESLGHPPSDTTINLYVALKPHRENALVDALYDVSSPRSPKYRAHLSKEQVAELVAPHPNTLELVNSWLEHHGVPSSSVSMTLGGNTLKLKGVSVSKANALLGASYQLYRHIESSETLIRTVGYALPAALHRHVLTVSPTTSFVPPHTQWQAPQDLSGGATAGLVKSASGEPATVLSSRVSVPGITPQIVRWLYSAFSYVPAATDRNRLGVAGYLLDYPSPADLAAFMREFRSDALDATYTVVQVNGGKYNPSRPTYEANTNIQYAGAITYPTPNIFYSTGRGPSGTDEWLLSWLEYIMEQPNIPQTISTSYGHDEKLISRADAKWVCDLFAQLGARGVSLLFPSGNKGVGDKCVTTDGSVRFRPLFPATCPHVTAVGGTTGYEPEVAWKTSGGGFSDYFLLPDYQEHVVPDFLNDLGSRYKGLYNDTGRGVPDVAAQSVNYRIFLNGEESKVTGTSAATPVVAGIISLLNDYLLSKGEEPLGFLNPWLYGDASDAFSDITRGSNPGCGTPGFSAVEGWDPVTGLGTPDLVQMQALYEDEDEGGDDGDDGDE